LKQASDHVAAFDSYVARSWGVANRAAMQAMGGPGNYDFEYCACNGAVETEVAAAVGVQSIRPLPYGFLQKVDKGMDHRFFCRGEANVPEVSPRVP